MQETPSLYEGRIALHQLAWSSIGHPYGHDDHKEIAAADRKLKICEKTK